MTRSAISGSSAADIAASIEQGLHDGRRQPGEPLPTIRELASALRVSPATVAAAYRRLRTRGLIAGAGRRGTHVVPRPPTPAALPNEFFVPAGTVDLASGAPDPALLPDLAPALRIVSSDALWHGDRPLVGALMRFAAAEFAADGVPARSLTVLSGALDAIERVCREHLRPGDRVAVEDPCFPAIVDLVTASGFEVVPVAIDDEGPLPNALGTALRRQCRAVIVTPRAQNPTGAVLTDRRARELRRVMRGFPDVVLFEDDYAAPVAGAPFVSLRDPRRGRWVVARSTSTFLGPDVRIALVAGDELTIARVEGRHALGMGPVSRILQRLVVTLWSDPAGGRLLARAAAVYAHRRTQLLAALTARGIEARGRSGLNVWVPVREETGVVTALVTRGWAVAPGERFRLHTGPAIRITAGRLAAADAGRFADDLADALRPARARFA